MTLLALSTSTGRGSAAVERAGRIASSVSYEDLTGHAERIFGAIDAALLEAGAGRADLRALACDIGPGSFTGVRVAVASAKGIALALRIPIASVGSLEAMASAAFGGAPGLGAGEGDVVLTALDAKKDEVFVAVYAPPPRGSAGASGPGVVELAAPRHVPRALVAEVVSEAGRLDHGRVVLVGEVWGSLASSGARWLRGEGIDGPTAAWVARVGRARFASGDPGDPAAVEPLYVRAPDAKPAKLPGA